MRFRLQKRVKKKKGWRPASRSELFCLRFEEGEGRKRRVLGFWREVTDLPVERQLRSGKKETERGLKKEADRASFSYGRDRVWLLNSLPPVGEKKEGGGRTAKPPNQKGTHERLLAIQVSSLSPSGRKKKRPTFVDLRGGK